MDDDGRPELDRRSGGKALGQRDGGQVVVEVGPAPTVERVTAAAQAGTAVCPGAEAPEIVAGGVGQEDIGAPVQALGVSLELAPKRGQRCEVGRVGHGHQQVGVLGSGLRRGERAKERDPGYARQPARRVGKAERLGDKVRPSRPETTTWRLTYCSLSTARSNCSTVSRRSATLVRSDGATFHRVPSSNVILTVF
jgi:hypothetical protein